MPSPELELELKLELESERDESMELGSELESLAGCESLVLVLILAD